MELINDMDATACYLCKNIQGAKLAYVQSDEISIMITDFDTLTTDMWFDGNIQKIVSVAASMATSKFNQLRQLRYLKDKWNNGMGITTITHRWFELLEACRIAEFDARVFTIPSKNEVENYFIWRQQDCVRNSIASVAQSLYSHKELHGKNSNQMQEMCWQKGINWNDYEPELKRGRLVIKQVLNKNGVERHVCGSVGAPEFSSHVLSVTMIRSNEV
jgi:tRNA(His) 5'-end guanylyltransferase